MVLWIAWPKTDSDTKDIGIPHNRTRRTWLTTHVRCWIGDTAIRNSLMFYQIDRWGKPGRKPLSAGSARLGLHKHSRDARLIGTDLEPTSPHGPRTGFATMAYTNSIADERIIEHRQQNSLETTLDYVRRNHPKRDSQTGNVEP